MNFEKFIKPELLILIPVLYFIGMALKKSKISDSRIPLLLGVVSIVISALWVTATSDFSSVNDIAYAGFVSITQGVLVAGASVYINQIYLQSKKNE